jgi:hypothetical protein
MGQQQLLPLLLAAIVVGVAIILGMEMFAQESRTAERDEIHLRVLEVVGRAQDWYKRPQALGGGGRSFVSISWAKLNVKPTTDRAVFTMTSKLINSFVLTGTSLVDSTLSISYKVYADSLVLQ